MMNKIKSSRKKMLTTGHLKLSASIFHFISIQSSSIIPGCKQFSFKSTREHDLEEKFQITLSTPDSRYSSKQCTVFLANKIIGKAIFCGRLHSLDPRLTLDTCLQADVTIHDSIGQHVATISQLFDFEESTSKKSKSSLLLSSLHSGFPIEGQGEMSQTHQKSSHFLHFYSTSFRTTEVNAAGQVNIFIDKNEGAEKAGVLEVGITEHCAEKQGILIAAGLLLLYRNTCCFN